MTDPITAVVVAAFRTPGVALLLAGGILIAGIGLIVATWTGAYRPLLKDMSERLDLLHGLRGRDTKRAFLKALPELDRMFAGGRGASGADQRLGALPQPAGRDRGPDRR